VHFVGFGASAGVEVVLRGASLPGGVSSASGAWTEWEGPWASVEEFWGAGSLYVFPAATLLSYSAGGGILFGFRPPGRPGAWIRLETGDAAGLGASLSGLYIGKYAPGLGALLGRWR
jgi:hypothetical protein